MAEKIRAEHFIAVRLMRELLLEFGAGDLGLEGNNRRERGGR